MKFFWNDLCCLCLFTDDDGKERKGVSARLSGRLRSSVGYSEESQYQEEMDVGSSESQGDKREH